MNDFPTIDGRPLEDWIADLADDFLARVARGESPDISAIAQQYPEHAAVVRQVIQSLMHVSAKTATRSALNDTDAVGSIMSLGVTSIGDFEIVREMGRGGMGIVYEAIQLSLGRRVALKILPLAASLDPQKTKRFQIEAQTVATLQHPHIVPIFATGQDRDVHYMAMQRIDGESLDRRMTLPTSMEECVTADESPTDHTTVTNLSLPSVRLVATWGIQIARALDHAHCSGIVHRDVKPSNILIDRHQQAWITDFGLAHVETGVTLTHTGDLVGTLRYMSPEQGGGHRALVDHRSDIYSLGATLYEAVAGQPAFPGADRVTLMRQILDASPLPLRRVRKDIPTSFERIIGKAMAISPADRYATAAAMADDLQRFLDDRPILAKPPNIAQRLAHWSRRHRGLVQVACVVGVVMLAGLMASVIAISRQKGRAEAALKVAQANEQRASREANKARTINDVLLRLLDSAHPDAMNGSEYTVRELLDDVSATLLNDLRDEPEVAAQLQSTLGNAYRRLGQTDKAAPLLLAAAEGARRRGPKDSLITAQALEDLAWNDAARRDYAAAEQHVREAVDIFARNQANSQDFVHALWCLQHCLIYQNRFAEADEIAARGMQVARAMNPPATVLANILHDAAQSRTLRQQPAQAEVLARQAVELHRQTHGSSHPETAWGLEALGRALQSQEKWAEAEAAYREALTIFEQQYDVHHKSVRQTTELLTQVLQRQGRLDEANRVAQHRSIQITQSFWQPFVNNPDIVRGFLLRDEPFVAAQIMLDTSVQMRQSSQCMEAASILDECLQQLDPTTKSSSIAVKQSQWNAAIRQLLAQAAKLCPATAEARNNLAWELAMSANVRLRAPELAIELSRKSLEEEPERQIYWNTLGVAQYRAGHWTDAVQTLEHSVSLPGSDEYDQFFLAMALWQAGETARAQALHREALARLAKREQSSVELRAVEQEASALIR